MSYNLEKRKENFLNTVKNNGVLERVKIIGEYINGDTPIKCECLKHEGIVFNVRADTLIKGGGKCSLCQNESKVNNKKKTHKQFIKDLNKLGVLDKYEVIGQYVNAKTKIQCRCLIHKDCYFENTPTHLLSGQGCPICAREKSGISFKVSEEEFDEKLKESNFNFRRISSIKNMSTKIQFQCLCCNQFFEGVPYLILKGYTKCPFCGVKSSFNNRLLKVILMKAKVENLVLEYSPKWACGKRYDARFTIIENNVEQEYIIEVNGSQHYEDSWVNSLHYSLAKDNIEKDKIKKELAVKNGAKIIYINCSHKNFKQIFEEIKKELKNIINFDNINDKNCIIEANKNIFIEICNEYKKALKDNPKISIKQFSRNIEIPYSTIYKYVRIGKEIGLI